MLLRKCKNHFSQDVIWLEFRILNELWSSIFYLKLLLFNSQSKQSISGYFLTLPDNFWKISNIYFPLRNNLANLLTIAKMVPSLYISSFCFNRIEIHRCTFTLTNIHTLQNLHNSIQYWFLTLAQSQIVQSEGVENGRLNLSWLFDWRFYLFRIKGKPLLALQSLNSEFEMW